MSDVVVEKLTQKVVNMLEEVSEVNILIRRLEPPREILNKINERNDAIHAAIVHIEKGLLLDEKRLTSLEAQTKSLEAQTATLMAGFEIQKQQAQLLRETLDQQKRQREQFEQTVRTLNQNVVELEASIKGQMAKIGEELKGLVGNAFYRLIGWHIGFIVTLLVIVAIYFMTR